MRNAFLLLLLSGSVLLGAGTNTVLKSVEITHGQASPLGTFRTEFDVAPSNEVKQVWLVSSKYPKKRQLLYTCGGPVEILFSQNEKWLAINDYAGSNFTDALLFRQEKDKEYKQTENIGDKAWQFLVLKMGQKERPVLDHNYVQVLRWTDEHTILLCLHGHTDKHNFIDDWLCFYDVTTGTFSTDLDKHNKRHTTLAKEPRAEGE
jgi:hypothetical protein